MAYFRRRYFGVPSAALFIFENFLMVTRGDVLRRSLRRPERRVALSRRRLRRNLTCSVTINQISSRHESHVVRKSGLRHASNS
jgi:hypothetical protein